MDFFVTGLPRSKTAWMSMYLSRGRHLCHHELTAQYGINKCLAFRHNPEICEGNSDSGLLVYYKECIERFPYSPWINIIRDYDDVIKSAIKWGIPEPNIRFAIKQQRELREMMHGSRHYLEIPFDFNDLDLEEVCEHVGLEYRQSHTDRMNQYNIQMSEYQKSKLMMNMNLDSL
jgi:hypothetical protein